MIGDDSCYWIARDAHARSKDWILPDKTNWKTYYQIFTKIILESLNKYQDKGLKWNCNHCDNSTKATHIKLEKIQNTIDNVLNNIDNNFKVINSKIDNYSPEKNIQSFAEIVKNLPNNSDNIASTIKTALSRQSVVLAKSDEKELNHIIHGISDEEDLGKLMTKLFKNTLHCKLPTKIRVLVK